MKQKIIPIICIVVGLILCLVSLSFCSIPSSAQYSSSFNVAYADVLEYDSEYITISSYTPYDDGERLIEGYFSIPYGDSSDFNIYIGYLADYGGGEVYFKALYSDNSQEPYVEDGYLTIYSFTFDVPASNIEYDLYILLQVYDGFYYAYYTSDLIESYEPTEEEPPADNFKSSINVYSIKDYLFIEVPSDVELISHIYLYYRYPVSATDSTYIISSRPFSDYSSSAIDLLNGIPSTYSSFVFQFYTQDIFDNDTPQYVSPLGYPEQFPFVDVGIHIEYSSSFEDDFHFALPIDYYVRIFSTPTTNTQTLISYSDLTTCNSYLWGIVQNGYIYTILYSLILIISPISLGVLLYKRL